MTAQGGQHEIGLFNRKPKAAIVSGDGAKVRSTGHNAVAYAKSKIVPDGSRAYVTKYQSTTGMSRDTVRTDGGRVDPERSSARS